jgi:hypothetical protein
MACIHPDVNELRTQKAALEQRIQNYKENLRALAGPCSRSSVRKQIDECEMKLEQIRSQLGEI